jgi:hypothetical protein
MTYSYEIFNAAAGADQHAELEVQARIFHDGAQVLTEKTALAPSGGTQDPQHLRVTGHLAPGDKLPPGEYTLQVIVTDKLAKSKFNVAAQSVDFEVGGF